MHRSFTLFSQLGFDVDIIYLRFKPEGGFDRIIVPHTEYDGINGFVEMLKRDGLFDLKCLPPFPERPRRGFFLRWLNSFMQYFRVLAQFGAKSRSWKTSKPNNGYSVSGKLLTADETSDIKSNAKKKGVSTNTALLHALNVTILPYLDLSQLALPNAWIIPVMLYETAAQTEEKGSLTSIMEVNIHENDSLENLQRQIREEIAAEAYMGTWLAAILNSFLPDSLNRSILKSTVAKKMRVGTFSNLGRWQSVRPSPGTSGWSVTPPVHPGQPFGVGLIEYGGRLGVALKTDPTLGLSEAEGSKILDQWVRRLI